MRYESIEDLPQTLRTTLPEEAQRIYLDAYQEHWDAYDEEEGGEMGRASVAHREGMNAVELEYTKVDNVWYRRGEEPEESEEGEGILDQVKDIF